MAFSLAVAEQSIVEYNPQANGRPAEWVCIDDRSALLGEARGGLQPLPAELEPLDQEMEEHLAQQAGLYRQIGGGVGGSPGVVDHRRHRRAGDGGGLLLAGRAGDQGGRRRYAVPAEPAGGLLPAGPGQGVARR